MWMDFNRIWYCGIWLKFVGPLHFLLKSCKNTECLFEYLQVFSACQAQPANYLTRVKMSGTYIIQKNTHFVQYTSSTSFKRCQDKWQEWHARIGMCTCSNSLISYTVYVHEMCWQFHWWCKRDSENGGIIINTRYV